MSQKVRLRSAARHVYAGRLINIGEEFDAEPQDALDLVALNFARVAPKVRAMTTETTPALLKPKKRTYRRRDMKAEG